MKQFLKNTWPTILIFIIGIVFRLYLSGQNAHADLVTQSNWGKQADLKGTLISYYEWDEWHGGYPNHPPLISWIYSRLYPLHSYFMWLFASIGNFIALNRLAPTKFLWFFDFAQWFAHDLHGTTAIPSGVIIILKQFMILADLGIAWIIIYLSKLAGTDYRKYLYLYLLLPFSWYLSASWGQSDPLSFIFFIASFILLLSPVLVVFSPLLYAIAANLKPNCILLAPVYLYYWLKTKISPVKLSLGALIAAIFTLWTVSWFTDKNPFVYTFTVLPQYLSTSDGFINYNAYNFWYIFFPFSPEHNRPDTTPFLFVPASIWGWIATIVTTILGLRLVKKDRIESTFAAMFVTGFGSWLFMTGMHERYAFIAVVPVLLLSIFQRQYLKYFIILSTLYTFNLLVAYWPADWVKDLLVRNDYLLSRIFSAANVIMYLILTHKLLKHKI